MTPTLGALLVIVCVLFALAGLLFGVVLELRDALRLGADELRRTEGRLWAACEALRIRGFQVDADDLA